MKEIIQQAISDGYKSLSLSVDPENQAAVRLYENLDLSILGYPETSWTMKFNITVN